MTFLQLKQRLARRRGAVDGTLVTATATRYADALNESQRTILRQPGMDALRQTTLTFASVASTQQYALPVQGVARVDRVFETTNDRFLEYRPMSWLRTVDPDPSTGTPYLWIPAGYQEVHTQPSDASEVFVKSTAAGDTTQTAYVEGMTSGGYTRTASVTLTGTTAVTLSATITDFVRITKFYLSAVGAGVVTLHEDSGSGTELAKLAIGDTRAQYYSLYLYPTPSAAITYTCDVTRSIPEMSNDTDEPLIPEDFHDVLLDAAELRELRKSDDPQRWQMVSASYQEGLRHLRSWMKNHPSYAPVWGSVTPGFSRLGAWFPTDQAGPRF